MNIFECNIGLEKESLRLDKNGRLAQTEHPFLGDPNIDRDFCENQIEIISNPAGSPHAAYLEIKRLHETVIRELKKRDEYLWLFSNPPYFENDKEIPIAHFTGSLSHKENYREYLASKYGKRKMLFSGIHFNFSFGETLLNELLPACEKEEFLERKNALYLRLAKWVIRYSWLIVFLTAASPLFDPSFFTEDREKYLNRYASARCSEIGYNNPFLPIMDYTDLKTYISSIEGYVERKEIIVPSELYYPVRLKSGGANSLVTLGETGVHHIELRMIDLNPLSDAGIFEEDIAFLHLFLLYLTEQKDFDFTKDMQEKAIHKMYRSALFDNADFQEEAYDFLKKIKEHFKDSLSDEYNYALDYQLEKITSPEKQYAFRVRKLFGSRFTEQGFALSKQAAAKICGK